MAERAPDPLPPRWLGVATANIAALPAIVKFLIDLVVGGVVFWLLYLVSLLIHYAYVGAIYNKIDAWQISGMWILEELIFWLDVLGVGIYISLRFVTHVIAFIRGMRG